MKLHLMEPSDNVYERIPAPWDSTQTWEVPVPVITASVQQPSLLFCIWLFCLTLALAWWVDIYFLKQDK